MARSSEYVRFENRLVQAGGRGFIDNRVADAMSISVEPLSGLGPYASISSK